MIFILITYANIYQLLPLFVDHGQEKSMDFQVMDGRPNEILQSEALSSDCGVFAATS